MGLGHDQKTLRLRVEASEEGLRLDEFLARRLHSLSRMRIATLLSCGAGTRNGQAAHAGLRLRAGDSVELDPGEDEPRPSSVTPEPLPLEILHEDEDLLVVSKPSGMLVHPTRGVKTGTLANALAYHLNRHAFGPSADAHETRTPFAEVHDAPHFVRPGLVHRLDRDTSGLMVVAKGQRALRILSAHFQRRLVEKRYLALLDGRPPRDEMEINAPVGRARDAQPFWTVTPEGREARTRLRVLESRGPLTLVELEPLTGRTNQLRIHCAHLGHPVLGDVLYGRTPAPRLCLHAALLVFHHPPGGLRMEFNSPLPPEVAELFAAQVTDR
ncbi:MAG TPA: RluA family pseudouridine synthase [Pyrinomonadaceae bacterium]|nr:RluA family pseudouridine synthase [Pyrinomonadaceae bacterium]